MRNTFINRIKMIKGDIPDVFVYDVIPNGLRVQLGNIVLGTLGGPTEFSGLIGDRSLYFYQELHDKVADDLGVGNLDPKGIARTHKDAIMECIYYQKDVDIVFQLIEEFLRFVTSGVLPHDHMSMTGARWSGTKAIALVNERLREHGVGYYYSGGELIKIKDELIHREAVQPALNLLRGRAYAGANAEFLKAFEFYKAGDYEPAMVEATKALESVLKTICTKRGWTFDTNATASKLFDVVLRNNLVDAYMQQNFTSLSALLVSAATPRNKQAGHGQGAVVRAVPEYFALFALNMTASVIVLLVSADQALP